MTTPSKQYGRLKLDLGGLPPGSRLLMGLSGGLDYVQARRCRAGKGAQEPMLEAKVLYRFRCKYDRKVYEPGDTYYHRSAERMEFLASQDPPRVEWPPRHETPEIAGEPHHVGGGWYELPDGRRVRGKEAAVAAMRGDG